MTQIYNDPVNGSASTIGTQARTDFYQKKALIEARKTQFFSQMADVTSMPKNMGKKIKQYHYLPMLDIQNQNDQGINAAGVAISTTGYTTTLSRLVQTYAVEANATAAAAATNAISVGTAIKSGSVTPWTVTNNKTALGITTAALSATLIAAVPGATRVQGSGNLYGSSKDIGTITGKLPALSETGGRVNRVGFKRKDLEGTLEKFGFFDEYTQESLDFDTDDMLMEHINREMVNGANEITEDALQIDLINAAGVIKYAGAATQNSEINNTCIVTYGDLMRLSIDLDNNRTPKQSTAITGTRMVDTRVIPAARPMYIGSELLPTLKAMKDLHNNPAYIAVEKYAAGGMTMVGEEGSIDNFRIIVVPEMMKWSGGGAQVAANDSAHYDNGGFYDVFPMLTIGDASFTTIGFQTDGKTVKFVITHKKPGEGVADRNDPYGETGFMSIKWYYGFMVLRPERIGLIKTAATL
jgi:N4-gp56 family major capsid protein